jgi:hypothetical protein
MKLIISGVVLILLGIVLFVITLINWRKESFIKSFLAGVSLVIGILLVCSEVGAHLEVSDMKDNTQIECASNENV